jgi:RNA polymerase sigma factor (sigma-70 family)
MATEQTHSHDEQALLRSVAGGDPRGLAQLYSRHGDTVYRIAFRLTESAADANDVLQDVFVALPEALNRFDARGSFEGWLKRVAVRTALMKMRTRRRRRELSFRGLVGTLSHRAPPDPVDRLELERAIAELPDQLRAVFVLKEIEGFAHDEIADLLDIKRGTSEVRLYRARRLLRERLGRR